MDVSEYLKLSPRNLERLAAAAQIQVVRLKRLKANPRQAVRYMTARRLVAASGGIITMEALRRRGPMRGEEIYAGPLGEKIADIASTGPDIAARLARHAVCRMQFDAMLRCGRIPREANMAKIIAAFDGRITPDDFKAHARWRAAMADVK